MRSSKFKQLCAMGFGLGPGLLLSFVLAAVLGREASDRVILLLSMSILGTAIVTQAAEAFAVAELSKYLQHGIKATEALKKTLAKLAIPSAVGVIAVAVITFGSFRISGAFINLDAVWLAIIALSVYLSCVISPLAALLIVAGKSYIPLGTQGFRYLAVIIAVVIVPQLGAAAVLFFLLGDVLRAIVLFKAQQATVVEFDASEAQPSQQQEHQSGAGSLYQQFSSNGITQASVLVERAAISSGPTGAITYYEIADKIAYILIQAAYAFGILPAMAAWAKLSGAANLRGAYAQFHRDMRKLLLYCAVLAIPGAVAAFVISKQTSLPQGVQDIGLYAAVLLIAALPITYVFGAMRFLVMLGGQRYFIPVAIVSIVIMVVVGFSLFSVLGVVGMLLARLLSRTVTALLYWVAIRKLVAAEPAEAA